MALFKIFMAAMCLIAAIIICVIIVRRNYDYLYQKTPVGYWFFSIGISQVLLVAATYFLFEEWWQKHEYLALISTYFAIVCVIMYGIIEISRRFK